MVKKKILFISLLMMFLSFPYPFSGAVPDTEETGTLSIYFMQEQVGYEEYIWEEDDAGFTLTVSGRMTKPIDISIERMVVRMDKSFIPERYLFQGHISGVQQEIQSFFSGGKAVNTRQVAGQERTETVDIRRDAVLLPNPVFSPYMVLTKKYRCDLPEAAEISAYIIPQMEVLASIAPKQDNPCHLVLDLGPTQVELKTDEGGGLIEMNISSQNLRIVRTKTGTDLK